MKKLTYIVKRSKRKSISLRIEPDGTICVRAPLKLSLSYIQSWVSSKVGWIQKHTPRHTPKVWNTVEIAQMKQALMMYIVPRIQEIWSQLSLPDYTHISVTKAEHRWGSCSSTNRLCFSYRLAEFLDDWNQYSHLPHKMRYAYIDAIIVHELAHLQEKHHKKPFWDLVYRIMPEYKHVINTVRKNRK